MEHPRLERLIGPEYFQIVAKALKEHPGPWDQTNGYGDNGGRFTSIRDASHADVFDGERGQLPDAIFNLVLNLPEIFELLGVVG